MADAESATIRVAGPAAWDNNNSAGKPASKLTGDRQLSSKAEVESVVRAVFDSRRLFAVKDS